MKNQGILYFFDLAPARGLSPNFSVFSCVLLSKCCQKIYHAKFLCAACSAELAHSARAEFESLPSGHPSGVLFYWRKRRAGALLCAACSAELSHSARAEFEFFPSGHHGGVLFALLFKLLTPFHFHGIINHKQMLQNPLS